MWLSPRRYTSVYVGQALKPLSPARFEKKHVSEVSDITCTAGRIFEGGVQGSPSSSGGSFVGTKPTGGMTTVAERMHRAVFNHSGFHSPISKLELAQSASTQMLIAGLN